MATVAKHTILYNRLGHLLLIENKNKLKRYFFNGSNKRME